MPFPIPSDSNPVQERRWVDPNGDKSVRDTLGRPNTRSAEEILDFEDITDLEEGNYGVYPIGTLCRYPEDDGNP
jgi:hypothetical protein